MLLLVALIFIILGILIKYAKMHFLIAGYNTMSKEKQKQYDIEGIASVFRNAMFGMALLLILGYVISRWFDNSRIAAISLIVSLAIGLPYVLLVSNSKKYKTNTNNSVDPSNK